VRDCVTTADGLTPADCLIAHGSLPLTLVRPVTCRRLPWNVLYILATLIEPALPRSCGAVLLQRFIVWFDAGFDSSPYVDHRSPFANNLCDDDEYKGTFIAGRNTFVADE
jgi:hypothetical protein